MGEKQGTCPLCQTSCFLTVYPREYGGNTWFRCSICGDFGLSNNAEKEIAKPFVAERIGMLLAERKLTNAALINLSHEFHGVRDNTPWIPVREFLEKFPRPEHLLVRVLQNMSHMVNFVAEPVKVIAEDRYIYFSRDTEEMIYVLKQLEEQDCITKLVGIPSSIRIKAKGWEKVRTVQAGATSEQEQAFVAMWFDESMEEIFQKGIKPAVKANGSINCVRIDLIEHNNKICDEIIKEIKKSQFVIADFTGGRGGVYFEAGYAHGRGIPVIYTVRKSDIDKLHFDTRQYNHIVYDTPEELYEKLCNRIAATILL